MPISVLARGPGARDPVADTAAMAVFAELRDVDGLFSPYRADSAVSRLNRGEIELTACPAQVHEIAQRCTEAREFTEGLFDADRPDGAWDPSGLVKGWAADRAARHLAAVQGLDWCLNCGGDVLVISPSGRPFTVGIADPSDPMRVLTTVARADGAVATSGTAARGAHLYDPRSGTPVAPCWASVTVIGPSLALADVLATAAFVAGVRWWVPIERAPGYAGLAVAADGRTTTTGPWPTQ